MKSISDALGGDTGHLRELESRGLSVLVPHIMHAASRYESSRQLKRFPVTHAIVAHFLSEMGSTMFYFDKFCNDKTLANFQWFSFALTQLVEICKFRKHPFYADSVFPVIAEYNDIVDWVQRLGRGNNFPESESSFDFKRLISFIDKLCALGEEAEKYMEPDVCSRDAVDIVTQIETVLRR